MPQDQGINLKLYKSKNYFFLQKGWDVIQCQNTFQREFVFCTFLIHATFMRKQTSIFALTTVKLMLQKIQNVKITITQLMDQLKSR